MDAPWHPRREIVSPNEWIIENTYHLDLDFGQNQLLKYLFLMIIMLAYIIGASNFNQKNLFLN